MTKYQEALDRLSSINLDRVLDLLGYEGAISIGDYGINDYPNLEMANDISTLQELVSLHTDSSVKEKINNKVQVVVLDNE